MPILTAQMRGDRYNRGMSTYRTSALAFLLVLLLAELASAQGTRADYERARTLRERTSKTASGAKLRYGWLTDGSGLWLESDGRYVRVDGKTGRPEPLFDHEALRKALSLSPPSLIPLIDIVAEGDRLFLLIDANPRIQVYDRAAKTVTAIEADETTHFDLAPGGQSRSRNGGRESAVIFANLTGEALELFWLDTNGRRNPYGRLEPGQNRWQHTFAGHTWILVRKEGKPLRPFTAGRLPAVARVKTAGVMKPGPAPRAGGSPVDTDAKRKSFGGRAWWSSDSRHAAVIRTEPAPARTVHPTEGFLRARIDQNVHRQRRHAGEPLLQNLVHRVALGPGRVRVQSGLDRLVELSGDLRTDEAAFLHHAAILSLEAGEVEEQLLPLREREPPRLAVVVHDDRVTGLLRGRR